MQQINIKIPKKTADKLQKRIEETDEFKNIEEYAAYILEQVAEKLNDKTKENEEQSHKKEDEEKVKERLRSLGYLE